MWRAFSNDMIQRFNTANKSHQRQYLSGLLSKLNLTKGSKVLDFGCGTGLFVKTFGSHRLDYYGYDIDSVSIEYAKKLNKGCNFITSKEQLQINAPFDLIVANCCFHHIENVQLLEELNNIKNLLSEKGKFILIDKLALKNDPSYMNRLFTKLEKGRYVRFENEYKDIIRRRFKILDSSIYRTSLFSLRWRWVPIYSDLLVLQCAK